MIALMTLVRNSFHYFGGCYLDALQNPQRCKWTISTFQLKMAQSQIQGGENTVYGATKKYSPGEVDFPSRGIPFHSHLPVEQGPRQIVC